MHVRILNTYFLCKLQVVAEIIAVTNKNVDDNHCVKSVRIRSFFWSVFSRIRTEYGPKKLQIETFYTQ